MSFGLYSSKPVPTNSCQHFRQPSPVTQTAHAGSHLLQTPCPVSSSTIRFHTARSTVPELRGGATPQDRALTQWWLSPSVHRRNFLGVLAFSKRSPRRSSSSSGQRSEAGGPGVECQTATDLGGVMPYSPFGLLAHLRSVRWGRSERSSGGFV